MIALLIIEYILAICLIVIMLVLFVPIFFHLQISKYNDLILWAKVNWLLNVTFFIIHVHFEFHHSYKKFEIVLSGEPRYFQPFGFC